MKGRDHCIQNSSAGGERLAAKTIRQHLKVSLSAVLVVLAGQMAWASNPSTLDGRQSTRLGASFAAPTIDVSPTVFPGLALEAEGKDSVVVAITNLGDAPLTYTMSVTNDNAGAAHVQVNGGLNFGSVIPPAGFPESVTIVYDAVSLLDGSAHNWRIEVSSNDPANDPGQGGVPIDINLQVLVFQGAACIVCGDVDQSGVVGLSDIVLLSDYLFNEGPAPPNPDCADLDDHLLPTMRDQLYLADFLFSGGAPLTCPPENSPCPPMPGGNYQLKYDPLFRANRTTDTLFINLVNQVGLRGLVVPLQILVDGAIPTIGSVQVFNNGGWSGSSALINPAGAPAGSVLLAYNAAAGSVPPGDELIAAIEISVPFSASGRLVSLDIGAAFPPMVNLQNVNYAVAIDDDPALNCWDIELLPVASPVVDCGFSFAESCLTVCPAGDIAFSVSLRDLANVPIVGSNDVWLDFSTCTSVVPCSSETNWPLVFPAAPSSGNGEAIFLVNAGGCDEGCAVQVMSSCGPIATVPIKSFDLDGDLFVSPLDFDGSLCNDYNCTGVLEDADLFAFTSHVSHSCAPDIKRLIRPTITLSSNASADAAAGDTISITIDIRNLAANNVTIDSVVISTSGFDVGAPLNAIPQQPAALDAILNLGDVTSVVGTLVLPPFSRSLAAAEQQAVECVTAEVYTSAAAAPVVAEHCERLARIACTPDTAFDFRFFVPEIPVHYWPFILMPTGFSAIVNPDKPKVFVAPDSVTASVSIDPPTATLGDSGTVIMLFCEDEFCVNEVTERRFRAIYAHQRGDVNDDCRVTSSDIIYLVNYVLKSGPEPLPYAEIGNIDCLGDINSSDIITLVNFTLKGGDPLLGDCP